MVTDGDTSRWWLGFVSYVLGVVAFLLIAWWAADSLDGALRAVPDADEKGHTAGQHMALLYLAKAILVLTVGGFSIALIRAAERLTMPLARYLQMVEYKSGQKTSEAAASSILDDIRKLIETGSHTPKG